jgi:hypothetical protein
LKWIWFKFFVLFAAGLVILLDTASVQSQWAVLWGKLDSMLLAGKPAADPLHIWKEKDYLAIHQRIESLDTKFSKDLIKAIAWCESEWNHVDADGRLFVTVNRKKNTGKSGRGITLDYGIMQINERMESLNRRVWDWERIKRDPEYNLRAGVAVLESKVRYVRRLKRQANWPRLERQYRLKDHDDLDLVLKAYNGFQPSWNYPKRIRLLLREKPWEKAILRQKFQEANWPDAVWTSLAPEDGGRPGWLSAPSAVPEAFHYRLEVASSVALPRASFKKQGSLGCGGAAPDSGPHPR